MTAAETVEEQIDVPLYDGRGKLQVLVAIHLFIDLVYGAAATSAAVTVDQWFGLLQYLQVHLKDESGLYAKQDMRPAAVREMCRLLGHKGPTDAAAHAANTEETVSRTIHIVLPLRFPKLFEEPALCAIPAAFLKKLRTQWCAATYLGTGNTITEASTKLRCVVETMPDKDITVRPRLRFERQTFSKLDQQAFPIHGRIAAASAIYDGNAATSTIGSTDFTDFALSGRSLSQVSQKVDNPTRVLNAWAAGAGDASDVELALPTSGSARQITLVVPQRDMQLGDMPEEDVLTVTLTEGAGNPAPEDQAFYAAVVKDRDEAGWARNWALANNAPAQEAMWAQAIASAPGVGRGGKRVKARGDELARKLPVKVGR
jgi:hypothetical protein